MADDWGTLFRRMAAANAAVQRAKKEAQKEMGMRVLGRIAQLDGWTKDEVIKIIQEEANHG